MICEIRRRHPGWGPRRIEHELARPGIDPVPSRSSIYRCLKRHGLIELGGGASVATSSAAGSGTARCSCGRWTSWAGVLLDDATDLKVVTGIDDHSRFCVAAGLVRGPPPRRCARCSPSRCTPTASPMRSSPTTARSSPGGSGPTRSRCCSIGSAERTGSRTATPRPAHRPPPARSSGSTRACARSSSPTGTFPSLGAGTDASSTPGSPTTTPTGRTRPSRWRRRPIGSAWRRSRRTNASIPVDAAEDHRGQWVLRRVGSNGVRLGRQPAVLGRQRLQRRARGCLRRRHRRSRSGARTT